MMSANEQPMIVDAVLTNWKILWRLGPLLVLAVAVGVPAQIRVLASLRGTDAPDWGAYVGPTALTAIIALLAAVIGTVAAARVGLEAPVLQLSAGTSALPTLALHLGAGVAGGLLAAVVILPFYYGIMRPLYEPETLVQAEGALNQMGLPARIAMGGVFEEVVFRWAALGLIAWAGLRMTGGVGPAVQWVALVGAALLFGLAHLPGASTVGVQMSFALLVAAVAMNGCLGIVTGWLVWHRGLVAAMTAHATVHIVWFAVERVGRL